MKKLVLTIAIVLGMGIAASAQGGLFKYGEQEDFGMTRDGVLPGLPGHGETGNQDAPLGTGIAMLTAFGAAYLVAKKRNEE